MSDLTVTNDILKNRHVDLLEHRQSAPAALADTSAGVGLAGIDREHGGRNRRPSASKSRRNRHRFGLAATLEASSSGQESRRLFTGDGEDVPRRRDRRGVQALTG